MPNLLVTTCGTSLLTNDPHHEMDFTIRQLLQRHTNHALGDISKDARKGLARHIEQRRGTLLNADNLLACKMSAELNGIVNYYARQTPLPNRDVHVLIHTDTWLGEQVAIILAEKLQQLGAAAQLQCATHLNTIDLANFQEGLGNLVEWAAQTLPGYRQSQYRVIFNLVGGFKSLQGFMQTLGMFYGDEILYIFESSNQLLRIPKLPIDLDASARKAIEDHLATFRLLDVLKTLPSDHPERQSIPELFLYRLDSQIELSPWGKIVWNQAKRPIYQSKLLDSPSAKIIYTEKFTRDALSLASDRLEILNTRIDDLARYLLNPDQPNPKRLDVKPLKENPMPPSTHECDAWADADCRRIYLRFENGCALLDRIAEAIH